MLSGKTTFKLHYTITSLLYYWRISGCPNPTQEFTTQVDIDLIGQWKKNMHAKHACAQAGWVVTSPSNRFDYWQEVVCLWCHASPPPNKRINVSTAHLGLQNSSFLKKKGNFKSFIHPTETCSVDLNSLLSRLLQQRVWFMQYLLKLKVDKLMAGNWQLPEHYYGMWVRAC